MEPSTDASRIAPVNRLQAVAVDDRLVVLDPISARRVLLNATAALIFTAVDTQRRVGDVVTQIAEESGVDADVIGDDVRHTVDDLLARGMLHRDDLEDAVRHDRSITESVASNDDGALTIGVVWAYDSGPIRAAGTTVAVRCEVASPGEELAEAFAGLPRAGGDGEAAHRIEIVLADGEGAGATSAPDDDAVFQVVVDGVVRSGSLTPGAAVALVFDQLDLLLVDRADGLRFHAGAVERDGDVVVIVGQSGHGKSTLTAALVQAGWRYLTDELAAVDASTFAVAPYARPLDLSQASLDQLHIGSADLVTGARKDKVFPSRLGQLSAGGRVAAIVVLTGEPPEDGLLVTDLATPEAVMALLALTFAATFDDPNALEHLARLCALARTVRLHRARLDDMVAAVEAVAASVESVAPIAPSNAALAGSAE